MEVVRRRVCAADGGVGVVLKRFQGALERGASFSLNFVGWVCVAWCRVGEELDERIYRNLNRSARKSALLRVGPDSAKEHLPSCS